VASLYKKTINGKPYYYLREMAWVEGKPKMVSERYVGSAADIASLLDVRERQIAPERIRALAFGGVAAVWGMTCELGLVAVVDAVLGARRSDAGASAGTYLALAVCNRVVAPTSKAGFADWWGTTAADRFTKIPPRVLDHRKFWDAMRPLGAAQITQIERALAARIVEHFGVDASAVALDMTNFATYIDSTNGKASLAQRGKAKQKRTDLRIVGLGLVVTRDGGIPLLSHTYPGNRPDVSQFPDMIEELAARYRQVAGDTGTITVVFDAGQNSVDNFATLASFPGLHYVGSVPPSDCSDLLALPADRRRKVDEARFGQLTAVETRREVYGKVRRVVLTCSPGLYHAQRRGFAQTLAKATGKLDELAATLARGKSRRPTSKVQAEIDKICKDPWVREVVTCRLTGTTPATHRLDVTVSYRAQQALAARVFGKRILITDHDDWPVGDVVAAYRSQSEAEFGFRQMKDPHVVSFSPMWHFTDHNIRVHVFTCVLALQIAHLMRRKADHSGLHLSVREILTQLAGVQEAVSIYPSTGGRPKARRQLTETSQLQDQLSEIFDLTRWAPSRPS
jgi:transposase